VSRYPISRLAKKPLRTVWRRLPMPIKHRVWPYVIRLKGGSAAPLSMPGDWVWSTFHSPGQDIAFPPAGLAAERLCAELATPSPPPKSMVMLGPIGWSFRLQRPQKLAIELGRLGTRVVYVNPTCVLGTTPGFQLTVVSTNVLVATLVVPLVVPPYDGTLTREQADTYLIAIQSLRETVGIVDAWTCVMLPFWTQLALLQRERWGWPVWYDRMDHWKGFERVGKAYGEAEEQLLNQADAVTATASSLLASTREVMLVPNACDASFATFPRRNPVAEAQSDQGGESEGFGAAAKGRTIGYVGAIAEWFDPHLVAAAAKLPNVQVELYGATSPESDVDFLRAFPNVTFHGEIPHSQVCDAIDSLDICLLPFDIRPLTISTDPVKVYEYLARGKRVVASALPELARFDKFVSIAHNPEQFAELVEAGLTSGIDDAHDRVNAVKGHTWADRAEVVHHLLERTHPLISVVILNWNNAALTASSIRTLLQTSTYPRFEIICVDNGSEPADVARLRHLVDGLPFVKLVENVTNLGFAGGMNSGVVVSQGEVIVLLNNDAFIGPGGLEGFERHLRDPKVGLLGAVTNWTGNEAKIDIDPPNFGEFLRVCANERLNHVGEVADVKNVAFFCVAMRRSTWDEVGPLDNRFGVGMFEDDDYCRRIIAAQYRVRIARDLFVYHVGEASFATLKENGDYDRLFAGNRQQFEAKWDVPWQAHTAHPLKTNRVPFLPIIREKHQ
jgi:GT2 family glycosyltransferase/glycosyltransferase involved in cell wall biosynthesis